MSYSAPMKDMMFVLRELADLENIATLPGFEDANLATAQAVLEESAKLCCYLIELLNVEVPIVMLASGVPYLKLARIVLRGWQMARALLVAAANRGDNPSFYGAKIATAQFYAEHVLTQASTLAASIVAATDSESVLALSAERFCRKRMS